MTRAEFFLAFKGRFLVFLTDAWGARKEQPSSLGLLMDKHHNDLKALMNEVFDTLTKEPKNANNGPSSEQSTRNGTGGAKSTEANGHGGSVDRPHPPGTGGNQPPSKTQGSGLRS